MLEPWGIGNNLRISGGTLVCTGGHISCPEVTLLFGGSVVQIQGTQVEISEELC